MDESPEITESDLLKLVVGNVQFNKVKEQLSAFNPFRVLRLSEYEIRHSNMIAWLFDPREAHVFDDLILKTFFFEVCNENPEFLADGILTKVYKNGLDDAQIIREQKVPGGFIDLLIISEQSKLVLVIENKFRAKESKGQLKCYREYAEKTYPKNTYKIVPIFLTLSGDEPSSEVKDQYAVFSYEKLVPVIGSALQIKRTQMSDEMSRFVNYYLDVLKEELGMNEKVQQLCKQIYRDHRDVIDKIYDVGNDFNFDSSVSKFIQEKLKDDVSSERFVRRGRLFAFVEKEMALPRAKMGKKWDKGEYAVAFWYYFNTRQDQILFYLEVGPFGNSNKRIEFLKLLQEKYKIRVTIKDKGMYSRVAGKRSSFDEWSDPDLILKKMITLYESVQDIRGKIIQAMNEFDWVGADATSVED